MSHHEAAPAMSEPTEQDRQKELEEAKEKERLFQEELQRARKRQAERYLQQRQNESPIQSPQLQETTGSTDTWTPEQFHQPPLQPSQPLQSPQQQPDPVMRFGSSSVKGKEIGLPNSVGGNYSPMMLAGDEGPSFGSAEDEETGNWWERSSPSLSSSGATHASAIPSTTTTSNLSHVGTESVDSGWRTSGDANDYGIAGGESVRREAKDKEKEDMEEQEHDDALVNSHSNDYAEQESRSRRMINDSDDDEEFESEEDDSEDEDEEDDSGRGNSSQPLEPTSMWSALGNFLWGGSSQESPAKPPPKLERKPSRLRKLKKKVKGKHSHESKEKKDHHHHHHHKKDETTASTAAAAEPEPSAAEGFFAGLRAVKDHIVDNFNHHSDQYHHRHHRHHVDEDNDDDDDEDSRLTRRRSVASSGYPGATYRNMENAVPQRQTPPEEPEESWVYMRSPDAQHRSRSSSNETPARTVNVEPVTDEELAKRLQRELEEEEERQRKKDEEYARQLQRELESEAVAAAQQTQSQSRASPSAPDGWFRPTGEGDSGPGFRRSISTDDGRVRFSFSYGDVNQTPPPVRPEAGVVGLLNFMLQLQEASRQQRHMASLRNSVVYGDLSAEELAALQQHYRRQGPPLRNSGDMTYENLVNLSERIGPAGRGTNTNLLDALPTRIYERTEKHSEEEDKCSICLAEYETGDELRALPCLHSYHKDCIDHWLKSHKTCPVCKYSLGD